MNGYRANRKKDERILIPGPSRQQKESRLRLLNLKYSLHKAQTLIKRLAKGRKLVDTLMKMRQEEGKE